MTISFLFCLLPVFLGNLDNVGIIYFAILPKLAFLFTACMPMWSLNGKLLQLFLSVFYLIHAIQQ